MTSSSLSSSPRILIIGGGLAGLRCATQLEKSKCDVTLLEASDALGGRVKTDIVDGHRLDHGFQVLLTSYPQANITWDYQALNLQNFTSGAKVWDGQQVLAFPDPWKHPSKWWSAFRSPVMSFADKLRLAKLRIDLSNSTSSLIKSLKGKTTLEFLRDDRQFSNRAISHFFRPFFSGIFLEEPLDSSAQMFAYLFPLFAKGDTSVPAQGMGALIKQLEQGLKKTQVLMNHPVQSIENRTVTLTNGQTLSADHLVIATDAHTASKWYDDIPEKKWNGTNCFYYSLPQDELDLEKTILLNADPNCPIISNIAPLSEVAPTYAPAGKKLIAVSSVTLSKDVNEVNIRHELTTIFGKKAQHWKFLKSYHIPRALPNQEDLDFDRLPYREMSKGVYICGDHQRHSSIQGALESGDMVAKHILQAS